MCRPCCDVLCFAVQEVTGEDELPRQEAAAPGGPVPRLAPLGAEGNNLLLPALVAAAAVLAVLAVAAGFLLWRRQRRRRRLALEVSDELDRKAEMADVRSRRAAPADCLALPG